MENNEHTNPHQWGGDGTKGKKCERNSENCRVKKLRINNYEAVFYARSGLKTETTTINFYFNHTHTHTHTFRIFPLLLKNNEDWNANAKHWKPKKREIENVRRRSNHHREDENKYRKCFWVRGKKYKMPHIEVRAERMSGVVIAMICH